MLSNVCSLQTRQPAILPPLWQLFYESENVAKANGPRLLVLLDQEPDHAEKLELALQVRSSIRPFPFEIFFPLRNVQICFVLDLQ